MEHCVYIFYIYGISSCSVWKYSDNCGTTAHDRQSLTHWIIDSVAQQLIESKAYQHVLRHEGRHRPTSEGEMCGQHIRSSIRIFKFVESFWSNYAQKFTQPLTEISTKSWSGCEGGCLKRLQPYKPTMLIISKDGRRNLLSLLRLPRNTLTFIWLCIWTHEWIKMNKYLGRHLLKIDCRHSFK